MVRRVVAQSVWVLGRLTLAVGLWLLLLDAIGGFRGPGRIWDPLLIAAVATPAFGSARSARASLGFAALLGFVAAVAFGGEWFCEAPKLVAGQWFGAGLRWLVVAGGLVGGCAAWWRGTPDFDDGASDWRGRASLILLLSFALGLVLLFRAKALAGGEGLGFRGSACRPWAWAIALLLVAPWWALGFGASVAGSLRGWALDLGLLTLGLGLTLADARSWPLAVGCSGLVVLRRVVVVLRARVGPQRP